MSGKVGDNLFRASGVIAAAAGGGVSWQAVETGATFTAVAGNGYPVNTTAQACTVTLPASASVGDEIIFTDYARNFDTYALTIDINSLNYQGGTTDPVYDTAGESIHIVYMDATNGWIPIYDGAVADEGSIPKTQKGIFAYGYGASSVVSMSNIIDSSGVIAADVSGVGTARYGPAAATYGIDKAIFGFGNGYTAVTNLVTNVGVIGADVTGVGTARVEPDAAGYGGDKAIFGFGEGSGGHTAVTNLVSSSGVVATDTAGVGTARAYLAATEYGDDKAIFGYGLTTVKVSMTNLVSNTGVVAADVTGVGTARNYLDAAGYGGDKAIFAYGSTAVTNLSNLVSNSGVVATDTTGVGTSRYGAGSCSYGGDKAAFAYGKAASNTAVKNLVTNAGVVGTDVAGVGTARRDLAGAGFSSSA